MEYSIYKSVKEMKSKMEFLDYTPAVSEKTRKDLEVIKSDLKILKEAFESLQKSITPIYSKYKQFKDVSVDNKFILGTHKYKKCNIININGNNVNSKDIESDKFDYIPDYEWVIEID